MFSQCSAFFWLERYSSCRKHSQNTEFQKMRMLLATAHINAVSTVLMTSLAWCLLFGKSSTPFQVLLPKAITEWSLMANLLELHSLNWFLKKAQEWKSQTRQLHVRRPWWCWSGIEARTGKGCDFPRQTSTIFIRVAHCTTAFGNIQLLSMRASRIGKGYRVSLNVKSTARSHWLP